VEAKILAARWSSHVRSPENTAVWIMTPNPAMNRTHKRQAKRRCLCAGYRKRWASGLRASQWLEWVGHGRPCPGAERQLYDLQRSNCEN